MHSLHQRLGNTLWKINLFDANTENDKLSMYSVDVSSSL